MLIYEEKGLEQNKTSIKFRWNPALIKQILKSQFFSIINQLASVNAEQKEHLLNATVLFIKQPASVNAMRAEETTFKHHCFRL
jgi:hypothetical protein